MGIRPESTTINGNNIGTNPLAHPRDGTQLHAIQSLNNPQHALASTNSLAQWTGNSLSLSVNQNTFQHHQATAATTTTNQGSTAVHGSVGAGTFTFKLRGTGGRKVKDFRGGRQDASNAKRSETKKRRARKEAGTASAADWQIYDPGFIDTSDEDAEGEDA